MSRLFLLCLLLVTCATKGHSDILISRTEDGTIAKYRSDGSLVTASFIKGLDLPTGILIHGSYIYVANTGRATIGRYNLDGTPSNTAFIKNMSNPVGLATDGRWLYATKPNEGSVGRYSLSNGAAIDVGFIGELDGPEGIVCHQGQLYVTCDGDGTVRRFLASDGTPLGTLNLAPYSSPTALCVTSAGNILVGCYHAGTVGEYTPALAPVNASLVRKLRYPSGIAIIPGDRFLVLNSDSDTVGSYRADGSVVNASLIKNIDGSHGIAVTSTNSPHVRPTVTVKGSVRKITSNNQYVLNGKSTDATSVTVTVGSKPAKIAKGTTSWTYTAKLKIGTNRITVTSQGPGGISRKAKITIIRKKIKVVD